MAKKAAKTAKLSVNSVALEADLSGFGMNVNQETPVVTGLSDAGPRRLAANYDHDLEADGTADFSSGRTDATLFALLGSAGVATDFDPTGTAAGASNPHYTTTVLLVSYSLRGQTGGAITFQAKMVGGAALTRATS